ncbi:MAG: zf-HC2 domain-containing protein, partial [Planctomycetes bacterium]|nr:zf-HC2 domain-containing protein [Planctomycetota bacterium]
MDCNLIQEKLSAYLDGELDAEGASGVQRHLEVCARCARELAELERLADVLDSLDGMAAAPDFASKVRAMAASAPEARTMIDLRGLFRSGALMRAAGVLVMVAGFGLGLALGGSV